MKCDKCVNKGAPLECVARRRWRPYPSVAEFLPPVALPSSSIKEKKRKNKNW